MKRLSSSLSFSLSFTVATVACSVAFTPAALAVDNNHAYVRFPALHRDTVVFTAEGDLWKTSVQGGIAQRLTTHPGAETHASISRDGQWIAFSATYEGAQEAYVMPIQGGIPQRISFENGQVSVLGWSAQGEVLMSAQHQTGPAAQAIIFKVHPKSLERTVFPVLDANEATLDDNGKFLYFTRLGSHVRGDNVKQYRGGAVAQLWRFDLTSSDQKNAEAVKLFAQEKSNNRRPMLWKNRLIFLSDRDGAMNLYSANLDGSDPRRLTQQQEWDVRNPHISEGKIVYQSGADIRLYDLANQREQILSLNLISDFDQSRQRYIKNPLEFLSNAQPASKEEKIVVTARGHLTVAGNNLHRRIDITLPKAARARDAVFSHDDKSIYAFVDSTGENEIWRFPLQGNAKPEQLTKEGQFHRLALFPSPDGKYLAHTDKRGRLWLLDLASKENAVIDDAGKIGMGTQDEVVWSADSKTIALTRANSNMGRNQIGLYDLASKQLHFVTTDRFDSESPVFSGDGKWLYFLSNRNFQPGVGAPWGDRNMGTYFDKRTGIFALALQVGNRFPFKPDDELSKLSEATNTESKDNKDEAKKPDAAPAPKKNGNAIVYEGLTERLFEIPLAAGNYRRLMSDDKRLYFLERDPLDRTRSHVKTLAISKTPIPADTFAVGVRNVDISLDKKHIFLHMGTGNGEFFIVDAGAKAPGDMSKARINIADWSFSSDPREEWQQMFLDAWRMHRDFLFDSDMRGVDWNAVKDKYLPLVKRITDRAELNDVLGLMVSEVATLHSQVRPGEVRRAAADGLAASLGAVLSKTKLGYRIDHIYRSEPDLPSQRAPLDRPDLDIKTGDIITAINGNDVTSARDISDLLLNQVDKPILLNYGRGEQNKTALVTPVNMMKHAQLRYSDWEQGIASKVEQASGGKIGYLHLRAMGSADVASFARDFYANYQREGLIIDVRRNNGGNIDSWIIEKLLRKAWAFWSSPGNQAFANMQQTFRGHLAVLTDELTYSDGETFAAGIKALKLAPLIGKRTSGAGVWLSDRNTLTDNGMVRAAEHAQFDVSSGKFLVEGVGVAPDIEVDNPPHASFKGEDKQVDTAIAYLQKKMKEQPIKPLRPQPIPPLERR